MTLTIKGEIHQIGNAIQVTDNFSKREIILKTDADTQYPQFIKLETSNVKNTLLDTFKVGENVSIDFNMNGRLHGETAFNNCSIWKINKI